MRVPHVLLTRADRLFAQGEILSGRVVALSAAQERHLKRVLRLGVGAVLSLTDGQGGRGSGRLCVSGVEVLHWETQPRGPEVTLVAGVSKHTKLHFSVEKATELGAARVIPVFTERTERRWDAGASQAKQQRWEAVARAALEQSRGLWLPQVCVPAEFCEVVQSLQGLLLHPAANRQHAAICEERAGQEIRGKTPVRNLAKSDEAAPAFFPETLANFPSTFSSVHAPEQLGSRSWRVVAVGPEGGFSENEVRMALGQGWQMLDLGSRILRTETASVVALSLAACANGMFE